MTFCVAIKVKDGLIALADGRITAGTQMTSARKISVLGDGGNRFFITTSGLRSTRDKVLAYMEQEMQQGTRYQSMLETVNAYTRLLRQVESEDRAYLEKSGIAFNLHTLIGGMMETDTEPRQFLVYPEGNWIEVDQPTPYFMIGALGYGKPILDRTLRYETDIKTAIKIAYLAFDSTKFSSSDVGFPVDMLTFHIQDRSWRHVQLENEDVQELRDWWNENITSLVRTAPDCEWFNDLLLRPG